MSANGKTQRIIPFQEGKSGSYQKAVHYETFPDGMMLRLETEACFNAQPKLSILLKRGVFHYGKSVGVLKIEEYVLWKGKDQVYLEESIGRHSISVTVDAKATDQFPEWLVLNIEEIPSTA